MSAMAPHITRLTIVYSSVYSGADQNKHKRSASLDFLRGIHRWPVNSPHKGPVTWKMFSFDDVIIKVKSKQQPVCQTEKTGYKQAIFIYLGIFRHVFNGYGEPIFKNIDV